MKEYDDRLTVQEVEELCALYMKCGLTPLEEAELEYVLATAGYDSELIRETRAVMGLSRKLAEDPMEESSRKKAPRPRLPRHSRLTLTGIAAGAAIAIASLAGLSNHTSSDIEYTVYANGRQLRGDQAREAAEAQVAKFERFERHMARIQEQQISKFQQIKTNAL